jgi:redox-sensitive bicupin YhaK (pirin superfamily)
MGFPTHGHRDMEIITYVLEGAIGHRDSMGNGSSIQPGNVQRMSAGSGVQHSEYNHAPDQKTHLLQIWIQPNVRGGEPSYEEKPFTEAEKRGQLKVIAAPVAEAASLGAVAIQSDTYVYAGLFDGAETARHTLASGRAAYVHVARGQVLVNGERLQAGDALKLRDEAAVEIADGQMAEVLLFDLARA